MPHTSIPHPVHEAGESSPHWISPATLSAPPTWTDAVSLRVQRDTLTDPVTFVWLRQSAGGQISTVAADQWPLLVRCVTDADGQARLHITTQAQFVIDLDNAEPPLFANTLPYNALEALAFGRFADVHPCQCCGHPPARLDGGIGVVDIRENKAIYNWNLAEGWAVIAPTADDVTIYYADAQLLTDCTKKC